MTDTVRRITTAQLMRALKPKSNVASLQYGVATALYQARPWPLSTAQLVEHLYGDDVDGGPLDPVNCLSSVAVLLRRRGVPVQHFRGFGWTLNLAIRPDFTSPGRSIMSSTA